MGVTKRDARNFDTICRALGGLEASHCEAMVSTEGEVGRGTKVWREVDLSLGAVECHADCSEVPLMYGEDVKGRAQGAVRVASSMMVVRVPPCWARRSWVGL